MSDTAIIVEGLGKKYRLGARVDPNKTLGEALKEAATSPLRLWQRRHKEADILWALKEVSFEVKKGQVLGIIGPNGAGKSTLLKILTRITTPTTGRAKVRGRVGSLLEVGTGFHQELSGRENVYLNGAILGMRKHEIDRKFDEIVAFSGVDRFIDTPIKRYSSGMKVRLAFSVAAHLEPEVLLVDEVLAVGDAEFRAKCLGKMQEVSGEGRTVLFVSHNMTHLQQLCPESLLLEHGQLTYRGETLQVIKRYLGGQVGDEGEKLWHWTAAEKAKIGAFVPRAMRIIDSENRTSSRVRSSAPFYVELEYETTRLVQGLKLGVSLSTGNGDLFCVAWNHQIEYEQAPGVYVTRCEIPANLLSHGGFIVGIMGAAGRERLFRDHEVLNVYIDGGTALSEFGRAILAPLFNWESRSLEALEERS